MAQEWSCVKGSSLLIPSGPDSKKHLFALMLDPVLVEGYGPNPHVLLACVTSIKDGIAAAEQTCLLAAGEHPFIDHDSYVDYRYTRLEQATHLQQRVKEGTFIEKDACSAALIKKIIQGALASRRIDREYKLILERVLFG